MKVLIQISNIIKELNPDAISRTTYTYMFVTASECNKTYITLDVVTYDVVRYKIITENTGVVINTKTGIISHNIYNLKKKIIGLLRAHNIKIDN